VDKVRGVILTGKLGVFSAGLDVKFLATLSKEDFAEWFVLAIVISLFDDE